MDQRLILVTLLIRLGVAAAISSVLVRARRFRVLLFREERTLGEKIEIVFIVGTPIALGVLVRGWVHNFLRRRHRLRRRDPDGRHWRPLGRHCGRHPGFAAGTVSGRMAAAADECAGRACWPGCCVTSAPEREAIWSFSPLFDLSIYHWIRRSIRKSFIDWQTSFFFLILGLEFVRIQLHRAFPRRIFALDSD